MAAIKIGPQPSKCREATARLKPHPRLADGELTHYLAQVNGLTKQEQLVLCIVLGLLLTGWAVKTYRIAHPPPTVNQTAKP
jgi:hypothetical protein